MPLRPFRNVHALIQSVGSEYLLRFAHPPLGSHNDILLYPLILSVMISPMSEKKPQVVVVFENQPKFICSKCSAVVVGLLKASVSSNPDINLIVLQALQDELISKSFSGRDGRG